MRRHSGLAVIRPAQITDHLDDDPVVDIAWPRADFRIASYEFLIGLLALAHPPADSEDWKAGWDQPPGCDELDAALAPLEHAFLLDGDGPRFMQDYEDIAAEPNDVAALLIEAPGEQTTKRNTDLLIKRGQVMQLGRPAAAMALYTLQSFAPAGGAGNRTGLRGGGPLTTLALPHRSEGMALWHMLWANVPFGGIVAQPDLTHILPWLAPTLTSEKGRTVTSREDGDRLAFWGMPRRIRLDFSNAGDDETCALTSITEPVLIRSWRQRPYGANYKDIIHPLTPYYRAKSKDTEWLAVHPQPGGIGYRHFLGLLFTSGELTQPAAAITNFRNQRLPEIAEYGPQLWRILAAGYDMDNMKARGFVEAEMPVHEPTDPERGERMVAAIRCLIVGAEELMRLLRGAIRRALFAEGATVARDAELFAVLRARFWDETAPAFFGTVERLATEPGFEASRAFLDAVRPIVWQIFEDTAPILDTDHPARVAEAQRLLGIALRGYGKAGVGLFNALKLSPPETAAAAKAKGKTRKESA